ncbi:hypothetical protein MLD52_13755 [Puniceicoccaceae bacterium K14]|nr:hypothetical protein [Puniceicoccaceae bacterium K14]
MGDEVRDIEAAKSAGIAQGAVSWGYNSPSILKTQQPTHFFQTVEEMTEIIRSYPTPNELNTN